MAKPVTVTIAENIATVLLNRPHAYNAFDFELIESLAQYMTSLAADRNIRAVIISGEGKAFCAGGDLKYVLSMPQGPSAGFHELAARFHQAVLEIRRMPKPVIAAINGAAAGGGFSLALACDFRVMAKSAFLRQAYTSNGLSIDGGGSFVLPRLVGLGRALEIMAFDRPISSEQAMAWGLVTKIVKDEDVIKEATEMAQELASGSSASFGWSKRLLTDSFDSSFETQIEREREGLSACAGTAEGMEGLKAFSEKRKPVFASR
ncbi:MAG: enoyl-CoA hydratase-related protein [Syntrophobacteraceae bacterium]